MSQSNEVNSFKLKDGVYPGRYTAKMDEPFVVFLIGMRVNRFWNLRKWFPVAMAMPAMMQELYAHPEKGFLGGESFFRFAPLTTLMTSYWRSFDDLERFAHSKDDPHFPAWKAFMKNIGSDGTVGIWHETYVVPAGQYECIYGNMPSFGLAAATEHVPVIGQLGSMRGRLGSAEPYRPSENTMDELVTHQLTI